MAYTQTDADEIRAAILKLARGEQAVSVRFEGPPARQIDYKVAQLEELRSLLASIERSLSDSPRPGGGVFQQTSYFSGFNR